MADFDRHFRDFDARMAKSRRRFDIMFRVVVFFQVCVAVAIVVGAIWLLSHPEAIGEYVGRIIAAFGEASQ